MYLIDIGTYPQNRKYDNGFAGTSQGVPRPNSESSCDDPYQSGLHPDRQVPYQENIRQPRSPNQSEMHVFDIRMENTSPPRTRHLKDPEGYRVNRKMGACAKCKKAKIRVILTEEFHSTAKSMLTV